MPISRRNFLKLSATGAAVSAAPLLTGCSPEKEIPFTENAIPKQSGIAWKNWSGNQSSYPASRTAPANTAELQELVASGKGTIRPVGSSHSFAPLVPTDDTLISLSRLSGVTVHDADTLQATIGSGTLLADMGQPLQDIGQALINMPDINKQSLGGSIATSTHGTGATLGSLSSYITGLKMVTASGDVVTCSRQENTALFNAARTGMGALGIITDITMQNTRPYKLRSERWTEPLEQTLERLTELRNSYRNYEFYSIPHSDRALSIIHDETTEKDIPRPPDTDNDDARLLGKLNSWLGWAPSLQKKVLQAVIDGSETEKSVAPSWQIYSSERQVRFNEMEYAIPLEHGADCIREILALAETDEMDVWFPIEFRYVKGDDIWLSQFQGRDSCTISIHRYYTLNYSKYFKAAEKIFQKYNGRPHWGKMYYLSAKELRGLYPHWDEFQAVRREMDPDGRFLNDHLKTIFGAG